MAYVDLNPVPAKMADSVENAEYTSNFERIHGVTHTEEAHENAFREKPLVGFVGDEHQANLQGISYSLIDYLM